MQALGTQAPRLITFKSVQQRVGLGKSRIYELIGEHKFPLPIKPGGWRNVWLESEIDAWLDHLLANRDTNPIGRR